MLRNFQPRPGTSVSNTLVICFALVCAVLAATGGFIFLSMHSLQLLDEQEAQSTAHEVDALRGVAKDADLAHAEIFHALAAATLEEKEVHVAMALRLLEKNTTRLKAYSGLQLNAQARKLYEEVGEARANFLTQTKSVLAADRSQIQLPVALVPQLSAYENYQKALGALINVEEQSNREMMLATTQRIGRMKSTCDLLLGLAALVGGWCGLNLLRTVAVLKKEKQRLQSEIQQREAAHRALGESEQRYRSLLEHVPDAVYVVLEGKIVFANPAAQKLLAGTSDREVVGREVSEFTPPAERGEIAGRIQEVQARTVVVPRERHLLRLDGTLADVETNSMPSVFEGQSAIQVITRDIGAQKSSAERLRAQEKQYRLLFEDNPSPMWVFNPRTLRFLAVNEAAVSHYGYSREEFLEKTLTEIRPGQDVPRFLTAVSQPGAAKTYSGLWQHLKKNGNIITVAIHSSPIEFDGTHARLATAFDITERIETERRIREREGSLALAQHVAGVGSWEYRYTPDGRFDSEQLFWSEEVYHIFGRSSSDFRPSPTSFFQAVHPADRARVAERFRTFQEKGGRMSLDHRLLLPDGSEKNVHVAAEVISAGASNRRGKVIGTIMDITEQVSKAQALEEAKERYRAIFANASEGIFQSSPEGKFLTVNPAAARIFGFTSPDEMVCERSDITRQSYVDPRRRADFIREIERRGLVNGFECEVFRKDGSKVWISENARAVRDASGRTLYFEGTIQDISKRKRAEEQLREQAELLNLAHDAIMVRDIDDRIEFWNRGAEELYGWTGEEARGRLASDFLYFGDPEPMRAARQTLLETGRWSGESQHLTKTGEKVIVRGRWSLLHDEFGNPKSKLVINTDITAQKKFEDQFLRTQRLESIGTLASGIAHDLNNVLLPVLMAAPILRTETDPEERNKFLDIVEASAQRGASIVKQVVTFARGADGEQILLQPVYLLEEIAKIVQQTFPKSITVRTQMSDDLSMIEADPTQLHQVLLNLCINARDAMPNGGLLTLSAENFEIDENYACMTHDAQPGPYVVLHVTDSGTGIPPEVLNKIFDPFFTTKGVGEGTGLGLSTVAGIVKGHGGFVRVYSEPGHTSFKVFLPAKANAENPVLQAEEAPVVHASGETILLVDDEPGILKIAEAILLDTGYEVLQAEDGPAALALYAQHQTEIDLVLTDVAMPLMSGLVLARALRKMTPGLKLIISTGRNDDMNSPEIAALQLDGFLRKPYTKKKLLEKISSVLHAPAMIAA